MHDRALDYARCTQALREDRERPGFAGIFDEALTNALAAIVAARWPGTEMRGSRVKSASELLDVIEEHGEETEVGVFELSDPHGPQGQELFGRRIGPVRTTVRVGVFRECRVGISPSTAPLNSSIVWKRSAGTFSSACMIA